MSTPTPPDGAATGITRDEVAHLARLARLAVSDEELDLFAGQLESCSGRSRASARPPPRTSRRPRTPSP